MVLEAGNSLDVGLANLVIEKALGLAAALKISTYSDAVFDVQIGTPYVSTDTLGERVVGCTKTPIIVKLNFGDALVTVFDGIDSPSRSADKISIFRNGEWVNKFREIVDAAIAAAIPPETPPEDTSFAPIDDSALFNG